VYAELSSLPVGARVDLPSLALPFLSQGEATSNVALALTRFSAAENGEDLPLTVLLRGRLYLGGEQELLGTPEPAEMALGSTVYLGLSRYGSHGFLEVGQRRFFLSTPEPSLEGSNPAADRYVQDLFQAALSSSSPAGELKRGLSFGRPSVLAELEEGPAGAAGLTFDAVLPPREVLEEADRGIAAHQERLLLNSTRHPSQAGWDDEDPRVRRTFRLATDADYQMYQVKGYSVDAVSSYYYTLVANAATIYRRDLGHDFSSVYLKVYSVQDPYPYSSLAALEHMQRSWSASSPSRSMAALISAKNLGGGMAYMRTLCNTQWAYAVSGNMVGYFPTPLTHYHGQNWDIFVFAHEIGHVWGASHTHDLNPAPDRCGSTPGCGPTAGSIMSYCHGCSGGMSNIYLAFHDYTKNEVWPFIGSVAC
jgi:hypothetical protein